jgi:uncharacterized protein (TIGR02611 family)
MDGVADDDVLHRLKQAAIEAEFDTGVREDTVEEARSHIVIRLARMTVGAIVTVVGVILLPLPGPGWLVIAAGLAILAQDVVWAERLLLAVRRRIPGVPEDGAIPRSSLIMIAVIGLATTGAAVWWSLGRG